MTKEPRLHRRPTVCMHLLLFLMFAISSFTITAQSVTGTITNKDGDKLPNATVTVKGTTIGTSSNADGRFTINVSGKAALVFSSVGYASQELPVGGRSVIDVVMVKDLRNLDEVVVTALGIKKQARGLGYSTTNVKPDELSVNRTPNVINALEGKVAGVNIIFPGYRPGGLLQRSVSADSHL